MGNPPWDFPSRAASRGFSPARKPPRSERGSSDGCRTVDRTVYTRAPNLELPLFGAIWIFVFSPRTPAPSVAPRFVITLWGDWGVRKLNQNKRATADRCVVTVEPGVYLPEHGGVRIEDTVVVSPDGCRTLTKTPKAAAL